LYKTNHKCRHPEKQTYAAGVPFAKELTLRLTSLFFSMMVAAPLAFGMQVTLGPSISSPAPVATLVTFKATATSSSPGTLWYRFRYHYYGQDSRLIKDYGPESTLVWTASDHEGPYEIDVDVRNIVSGEMASASAYFTMQSLVTNGTPVITPTSHPMVYLYSAPACPAGQRMRVTVTGPGAGAHSTPYQDCKSGLSMNYYLAGMRGNTKYSVRDEVDTGSAFKTGPSLTLNTAPSRTDLTSASPDVTAPKATPDGIVLQSTILTNPVATDLAGNLIWYYPNSDITTMTRPVEGGYFFATLETPGADQSQQVVRKFDLVGMTVLQTNAARVNEQLTALGRRTINAFHHEARQLNDGNILVIAGVEQILSNVQGPAPVDILGDMIIVMSPQLQVLWTWDTFDHLDTTRLATQNDQCLIGDCPPLYLAGNANDWTHANCVSQTPDGNLLFSSRAQDMVYKIDYENGAGNGNVLWRLGSGGDFQINSTDPSPWFSHQHDPQFLPDNSTLVLFDNGNLRNQADPTQNSRGQVLIIDEQGRTANLVLNANMGSFSVALGAGQKLPNGDYHFDNGYLSNGAYANEFSPDGKLVYSLHAQAAEYRSFRMPDLYSPPFGVH
jgi:arylsulfate sulfotransferase